ncbi:MULTISPECIES: SpoIIE family protein phosphatase [unclassified Streptomyces]|uniref:SpoIIE family protein phosphatase n=1 Tax=unclassified Streptomyces TaxID=2593676 RepID=UPI0029AC96EE|nr:MULTISPECIES: SpoIIE family protein phosphatase [unclassified Streptomyces]MDX3771191.1 SpoIIE family protein phosphatase [Streptomyces sp. AK08-01B]MDX3820769.1 SpoIIE family protein phosphatase [Streptomyces sp. AK08-01A]
MFTYLFEARPASGRDDVYRSQVMALQAALGECGDLIEQCDYRSATREGWLLWMSSWANSGCSALQCAKQVSRSVLQSYKESGLLECCSRAGCEFTGTDYAVPYASGHGDGSQPVDRATVVTVLSAPPGDLPDLCVGPRQRAERLGLDVSAQGLVMWDLFEGLEAQGETLVLLSWSDLEAAREFECHHNLPSRVRIRHIDVFSDYRSDEIQDSPPLAPFSAQKHWKALEILAESGATLSVDLDLVGTAQALTDLLVPHLAVAATVDIADTSVGESAITASSPHRLMRMGATKAPTLAIPARDARFDVPQCFPIPDAHALLSSGPRVFKVKDAGFSNAFQEDRQGYRYVQTLGLESVGLIPLRVCAGETLGLLSLYRQDGQFGCEDINLLEELARRACIAMNNCRAYLRERDSATSLRIATRQGGIPATPALNVRHGFSGANDAERYWFDVIALPGARTALAVGNTLLQGPSVAAATMRLRSAIQALSHLDLAPQELMTRVNDLTVDLDPSLAPSVRDSQSAESGTCLYLVYDPIKRQVTFAHAGEIQLVATLPTGETQILSGGKAPALGQPGQKYSQDNVSAEPGTCFALTPLPHGLGILKKALEEGVSDIDNKFQDAATALYPTHPEAAPLVILRTHAIDSQHSVAWNLPQDIAAVSSARTLAERQLSVWGLKDENKFMATLVISELVTNAIRYASSPISLRLIRQDKLTCEVSDGSSTAPYIQYALPDEEGGRGLYIVAECSSRWGVRHESTGKTIWAEQNLNTA